MSVQPEADGTFVLDQQFGEAFVRVSEWQGWQLAAVIQDGRDVTDLPLDVSPGAAPVSVVLTRRGATITGITASAAGPPVEAAIILISSDPALWHERSSTTRVARSGFDGRFRFDALRPGSYVIAAVPEEEGNVAGATASFFKLLAARGTAVSVRDGEPTALRLTVASLR
jgi:hypothetical protein